MARKILRYFPLVFIIFNLHAQSIYVPYNIQQAIKKQTRTNNGKPGILFFTNYSDYKINVIFNSSSGELEGRANITYHNNSPDTLKKIVMRLYQNILKPNSARDEEVEDINLSKGMIINDLVVNGNSYTENLKMKTRTEGTNFYVFVQGGINPGDSCLINIAWNFRMPQTSVHRFGKYGESTFFVAMWYPQIAVYDDVDGWDEMQYTGTHEFYNDFNNYDVTIKVSKGAMVWATGTWTNPSMILAPSIYERYKAALELDEVQHIIKIEDIDSKFSNAGRGNKFRFVAKGIPDFVFATSKDYLWDAASVVVDSSNMKRVMVSAVYPEKSVGFSSVASICSEVVNRLSFESYGVPYPFPAITIFNGKGGMEYPMMVNNEDNRNSKASVFLTLHEVAHAYFPFMTGINERKYSWIDEGLTSYLPMETQKAMNSDHYSLKYFTGRYDAMSGTEFDILFCTPAYQAREFSYYFYSYFRSVMAFMVLENYMGRDTFRLAIRNFIDIWQGKHPTPYDMINTFKNSTNKDIDWLINQWFFQQGYPDLSIKDVKLNDETVHVEIEKNGNLPVPVILSFIYEDGNIDIVERNVEVWKHTNNISITQSIKNKLIKIELGNLQIPDKNREDNYYTF